MSDQQTLLADLRAAVADRVLPPPAVRAALAEERDPALLRRAGRLLAGLGPGSAGGGRPVRVAVHATCTVGAFEYLLRARLVAAGTLPTIDQGEYGAFELTLAAGDLAAGDADVVACLMDESYFLKGRWDGGDAEAFAAVVERRTEDFRALIGSALRGGSATVVLHTVPLPVEVRDSFLSLRARQAATRAWYRLNTTLLELAAEHRNLVVVDLVGALAEQACAARDDRLHRFGDMPYTDGALLVLADEVRRVVQARAGLSRKVLALDLDNTLWGGVLGEVGAHGVQLGGLYPGNCYLYLQRAVERLRQQGVVLVLVSKNDPDLVEAALTGHPEVLLRPEAFAVRAVNWQSKADNLRSAVASLGLATDSVVFVDDSPFERGLIRAEAPEVAVVPADGDPAYLVRSLLGRGLFDVLELTDTDRQRPELYRSRAARSEFSGGFGSSEEYLHALGIELTVDLVTEFTLARVAQLAARTNQFNLTGVRFDEAATAELCADPDNLVAAFSVTDRFGSEGIVGAVWAVRDGGVLRVLNAVLSCRVLGRGVELAMARWLVERAANAGIDLVEGRFVGSGRNGVAADFWTAAGFAPAGDGVFTVRPDRSTTVTPAWITVVDRTIPDRQTAGRRG